MKAKWMKMMAAALAAVSASLVIAGCGGSAKKEAKKEEGGTLRVAMTATFPPFEYVDSKTQKFTGIDVDIANYIAKKLGKKVEVTDMKFASLIPTLQSGSLGSLPRPSAVKWSASPNPISTRPKPSWPRKGPTSPLWKP